MLSLTLKNIYSIRSDYVGTLSKRTHQSSEMRLNSNLNDSPALQVCKYRDFSHCQSLRKRQMFKDQVSLCVQVQKKNEPLKQSIGHFKIKFKVEIF